MHSSNCPRAGCEPRFSIYSEKKLDACSHLYDTSIVLGTHHSFSGFQRTVVMREQGLADPDESGISQEERQTRHEKLNTLVAARFPPPSFKKPYKHASLPAAAAAFLRTHEKITVKVKISKKMQEKIDKGLEKPPSTVGWRSKATLTKFKTLMADLHALRAEEPSMRAVVFTRHDAVQERLVALISSEVRNGGLLATPKGQKPLKVFEFNKHTAPSEPATSRPLELLRLRHCRCR